MNHTWDKTCFTGGDTFSGQGSLLWDPFSVPFLVLSFLVLASSLQSSIFYFFFLLLQQHNQRAYSSFSPPPSYRN